jgi:GTP-binding protein Era
METQSFKAGYVAVVGRPNVGKSTLINLLMEQKVAAISPRPQTTRHRQLGILTKKTYQVVFVDTPGIHKPHHKLGEYMNDEAEKAMEEVDAVAWLVDAAVAPVEEDQLVAQHLGSSRKPPPVLLVLNKIDLLNAMLLPQRQAEYLALLPQANPFPLSALTGQGLPELLKEILARMPEGLPFFAEEEITDLYERDIAAELIREAGLVILRDEVPHGIAVRIDEFLERGETGARITATLFVERESHKGIVIGQGGEMLKKIGSAARREIEAMSGRKVYLELRVKVSKNWRNNPEILRWLGYAGRKD